MRVALVIPLCLLLFTSSEAKRKLLQPLDVVPSVDLHRYAGIWYEIARLPNSFQQKCIGDVVATCTLMGDGSISIVNRCQMKDGRSDEARGRAKLACKNGPTAKLKVRFAPAILSFLPFVWGDYWIITLASDYSYAVVGDPDREYLWVLSRTPTMNESTLQDILDQVKEKGYDLSGLIRTTQSDK